MMKAFQQRQAVAFVMIFVHAQGRERPYAGSDAIDVHGLQSCMMHPHLRQSVSGDEFHGKN